MGIQQFNGIIFPNKDRSYLKKKILAQVHVSWRSLQAKTEGVAEFQPAAILKYFEELKLGCNAETCPPKAGWAKRLF